MSHTLPTGDIDQLVVSNAQWFLNEIDHLGSDIPTSASQVERIRMELAELAEALEGDDQEQKADELADVLITVLVACGLNDCFLISRAIQRKMELNRSRTWKLIGPGLLGHVKTSEPAVENPINKASPWKKEDRPPDSKLDPHNYMDRIALEIHRELSLQYGAKSPGEECPISPSLLRMYACLAASSEEISLEDVHNAWVTWANIFLRDSPDRVPFESLPTKGSARTGNERHREVITKVAKGLVFSIPVGQAPK